MSAAKDLTGQTIGFLKLLKRERKKDNFGRMRTYYYCYCSNCNNSSWIRADSIKRNNTCGCGMLQTQFQPVDLKDQIFDRLKAIKPTDKKAKNDSIIWECNCDCGKNALVSASDLLEGRVRSCGCLQLEALKNNMKKALEYSLTYNIVDKTNIPSIKRKTPLKNNKSGARGVSFNKKRNKWVAQIQFQRIQYYLGRYDTVEEAQGVYQKEKAKLHDNYLEWHESQKGSKDGK